VTKKKAKNTKSKTPERALLERARFEEARQLIRSAQYPLLTCHISPDGDAVGSLVALGRALRQIGQEPLLLCEDPIPSSFDYIPGVEEIVREVDEPDGVSCDLVIYLDCSDRSRGGRFPQAPAFEDVPLLNIDHHMTNLNFGDVNLVDPQASSTAQIVLRLLEHAGIPLDVEIATALLVGIVADTRGFRTNNVTAQVMAAALRLMEAGASLPYVAYNSLDRHPTSAIRLWGAALSNLRVEGGVAWAAITLAMRRAAGHEGNGDAGLVSFLVGAEDADVAAVFTEREEGRIEVGLRAVPGFDVARVALRFGGGGHALAAGCDLPGPLEEAQTCLLEALQAELARQRQAG